MFPRQFDDYAIRLAAGEWVKEQAAMRGGEVKWAALRKEFKVQDQQIPLLSYRGIWKPSQMELPLSIRTSPNNPYRDSIDPVTGLLNYRYFGTDPNHRDNAGLRRLMGEKRPLIYLYGLRSGRYLPLWPVYIYDDDPGGLTFVVAGKPALSGDPFSDPETGASLAADAPALEPLYALRTVAGRLYQGVFRERVLRAYRSQCAFCRLRPKPLLDAAHIVPACDPAGDPVVSNGMALCKTHHAAFDELLMGVRPDGVIEVRPDVLEERDGPMLRHGVQNLHDTPIHRPRRESDQPDPDRLAVRYREFKKAS